MLRTEIVCGRAVWRTISKEELNSVVSRIYRTEVDASPKIPALEAVAAALNHQEIARAQVVTLLMKIPNPDLAGSSASSRLHMKVRLAECGFYVKEWDPDKHPRTGAAPNPGWFGQTGGQGSSSAGAEKPSSVSGGSQIESQTQVAILTGNFRYACQVLKLDPDAASAALHAAKYSHGLGGADNCQFDTSNGDIYYNGEIIGNLGD